VHFANAINLSLSAHEFAGERAKRSLLPYRRHPGAGAQRGMPRRVPHERRAVVLPNREEQILPRSDLSIRVKAMVSRLIEAQILQPSRRNKHPIAGS
jgi:hypothetical protein